MKLASWFDYRCTAVRHSTALLPWLRPRLREVGQQTAAFARATTASEPSVPMSALRKGHMH